MKAHTFLTDHKLVRALRCTLAARGIRSQDLDDAVADIQLRMLERLEHNPAPQDLVECTKLCNAIAVAYAADAHRRSRRRARFDIPIAGDADADDYSAEEAGETDLRDPVDLRRLADALQVHIAETNTPDLALAILDGVANGMNHAELSRELGLTEIAVRRRLAALRREFRARLEAAEKSAPCRKEGPK